ncbi:MAG TPA: transglycosylase SLT domain-containing protein [Longimicrobiales bacterium]|nr:transglycosylase SLT domain-containing protein [Longimicrobiales bacterium]
MTDRRNGVSLVIGTILIVSALSAGWSAGRLTPVTRGDSGGAGSLDRNTEEDAGNGVEGVSWDLPVTHNERVARFIDYLSQGNRRNTAVWLERQGRYAPLIQAELRRRGMPEDLLYLALIESGLSPRAYSKAKASGMWQFIEETGQRYGLEVSGEVDERRDPIKSTAAALDYLQELYDRFGSWYLAAAAYNTGENRVERILREREGGAKGDDELYWRIAPYLPKETRDYVPLMLAMGHIAKEPEKYGFHELEYQEPLRFEVVWVPGATDLATIAQAAGVAVDHVEELNLHLTKQRTPASRGWSVRIPEGSRNAFDRAFPELFRTARLARAADVQPAPKVIAASAQKYHRVNRGDNLTVIARRYGTSVRQIRSWNGISGSRILPGQRLRVS